MFKGTSKSALFTKRTLKLFVPIPLLFFMVNGATSKGSGNFFSAPLSAQYIDQTSLPIHLLSNVLNHRVLPQAIQDHGDLFIYNPNTYDSEEDYYTYDDDETYIIESTNSFNSLRYGSDFSFKPVAFGVRQEDLVKILLTSNNQQKDSQITQPMFMREPIDKGELGHNETPPNPIALAKYRWTKENFEASSLDQKSDINVVADLKISTNRGPFSFAVSVDLSHLISNTEQEFVLLTSSKKDKTNKSSFFFKFSRDIPANSLIIELFKKEEPDTKDSPITNVEVMNFYVVFSDNPPLPYSQIFQETISTASDSFSYSQARVKQIFLDTWTNKEEGIKPKAPPARNKRSADPTTNSQFSFSAKGDFWKSICSDPYKVGGFIDEDPNKPKAAANDSTQSLDTTQTFVKQQTSLFEEFDPIKYSTYSGNLKDKYQSIRPYTTPTPCKDLDEATKTLLTEYAKPQGDAGKPQKQLTKEATDYINWYLTPQPIKDLLNVSQQNESSSKSKVIQGSFRAWGGSYASNLQEAQKKGFYNSLYEQANQSTHVFEVTIDKETVVKTLIDHEQLQKPDDRQTSKKLNQLPEISSQLQVSIPYSFTIYDPVSNFLKKQWVNLSVPLDLRSIYNQSQYLKEFFVYDMAVNNSRIGTDYSGYAYGTTSKAKNYGLSGTISFSAGLYLDVDGNLKIQLITKTKGFVNTKNPACDLRERKYKFTGQDSNTDPTCNGSDSNWSYRKHNHIPSFIVLEIHEDPKVSSFYLDRRVSSSDLTEETDTSADSSKDETVETLEKFKNQRLEKPEHTIVRTMDQTNNGEVYFEKLDVTDPKSPELQKASKVRVNDGKAITKETESSWFSGSKYFLVTYYVPRRNYGEIVVDEDSNLNEIIIHLKGSTSLGGEFMQSMHYGTKVTYCTSTKESSQVSEDANKQCGDGTNYEKIEKDKSTPEFKTDKSREIKISFDELKKATKETEAKKFNFQTVINRAKTEDGNNDKNKFDSTKTQVEFIFKDEGGFKNSTATQDKNKFPKFSLVGIWYSLELWWDDTNKKICYYTKVRAISSVADATSNKPILENSDAHKVVGASARAGFELSKMEFKYKKSSS